MIVLCQFLKHSIVIYQIAMNSQIDVQTQQLIVKNPTYLKIQQKL